MTKVVFGSLFSAKVFETKFIAISLPIAPRPMKPIVFDRSLVKLLCRSREVENMTFVLRVESGVDG